MKNKLSAIILLLITFLLISCAGGGTSGTGVAAARTLSGTVTQSEGEPVENAVVTIEETGESDLTDENGQFEIGTDLVTDSYNIQIEGEDLNTTVSVDTVSEETQNVQVDIGLDNSNSISSISSIQISAKIVGTCSSYFDNSSRIHQSVGIAEDLNCTIKFFASGDLENQEEIPAVLEVSSCDGLTWKEIARGATGVGRRSGVGQIGFTFIDDSEHCLYRLSAPAGNEQSSVEIFIDTFSYQDSLALR